ncbi:MAG: hypothetical protein IT378_05280 [Sandaracinaceae bacterium]|nr:hypothetical protein [Sandaracinaceae bacterium]
MEKTFGPPHMRMVELPLSEVVVDPGFNCREPHTEEELAQACDLFEVQPMLHPPTVVQIGERWILIAGFLRFAVWQRKGVEQGLFRWIEEQDAQALVLTNLSENMARRDLRPHEIAERIARLRELGVDAETLARHCRCSARWVRRVFALKRDAHPELWAAFVSGRSPHLTMARMLDLSDQSKPEQLRRLKLMHEAGERADEIARGFSDGGEGGTTTQVRRRKRYPPRRHAEKLLRVIERDGRLGAEFQRGAVAILQWLLHGTDLHLQRGLSVLASETLERRRSSEVQPSKPDAA